MALIVGTPAGNRPVADPVIGTPAGNRAVQELWVGTPAGNRLVWARHAYDPVALTATAISKSRIDLAWNTVGDGVEYTLRRGAALIYQGTERRSKQDTGLTPGTGYTYTIEARAGGDLLSTDTATATTDEETTEQHTVTLSPASSASYTGDGSQRATSNRYSGRYSGGSWGRQKSSFHFPIPSDLRGCVSVDQVEVSIRNAHTYGGSGVTQSYAITHTQDAGPTAPGHTALIGARATPKGGWYGGQEWRGITGDTVDGKTVAEHLRTGGAWGIVLAAPTDSDDFYSYWQADARLRITYTTAT